MVRKRPAEAQEHDGIGTAFGRKRTHGTWAARNPVRDPEFGGDSDHPGNLEPAQVKRQFREGRRLCGRFCPRALPSERRTLCRATQTLARRAVGDYAARSLELIIEVGRLRLGDDIVRVRPSNGSGAAMAN